MSKCGHEVFENGYCTECDLHFGEVFKQYDRRLAAVEKERDEWEDRAMKCHANWKEAQADLAAVEYEWDEWKRSAELVARVLIDTKADLTAAMKDKPKGRFLPDIEDLSHTIDFEEPKCGKCGGTHCVDTPFSGSDPSCPDCLEVDDDL